MHIFFAKKLNHYYFSNLNDTSKNIAKSVLIIIKNEKSSVLYSWMQIKLC